MNRFRNKTVWITGASSGIGEALAYAFAREGARLMLSARRMEELERVRNQCPAQAVVELLAMDLAEAPVINSRVAAVLDRMGDLDILVNNAGISQRSMAVETDMRVYREIMEVNFFGTIALTRAVLPHFIQKNGGQFINISSVAGKMGLPMRTAYCASKHALEGFFSSLRTEIWKTNIRVLMVQPAAVKTGISEHALQGDGSLFGKKDRVIEKGMEPANLAECILNAAHRGKKSLVAGAGLQKWVLWMNRIAPSVVFNAVKNYRP